MRCLKLVLILLLSLILASPATAKSDAPYVTPSDCAIDVPADLDIECGQLSVPENYDQPDGRWITMPYIIVHSRSADSDATPMVFTEGGPGGDSLRIVYWIDNTGVLKDRDVIIFQQRGNLHADPALSCELDELYDGASQSSPCLEKFKSAGIDLTQYTTSVIARDIESLRLALGIDQWNFFGVSYSTRLAQVLLDKYPEGLRSVILQSVSPLHETRYQHDPEHSFRVLQVMFEDCAADKACAAAYPNLEDRFYALVKELNQNPIDLTLDHPDTGKDIPYQVSGYTLINWMVGQAFYSPIHPPYPAANFPLLIDNLTAGDQDYLAGFAQHQLKNEIFRSDYIAFGLYITVNCQDDANSVTEGDITAYSSLYPKMDGFFRHRDEWELCQLWDLPPAAPLALEPVNSDVPVLVLAGRFDPITPPTWSKMVADNLENSFYAEFPSKGHSIDQGVDCGFQIKNSFLQDPWSAPDTSCIEDEPPPTFVLPDEIIPLDGFILSTEDINLGEPDGNRGFEIMAMISLVLSIGEILIFLGLSVMLVVKWSERRERSETSGYQAHVIAAMVAVLTISTTLLVSEMNPAYVWNNDLLNSIGYFQSSGMSTTLGATVLAQMIFCLGLILHVILAWLKKQTSILNRVFLTLLTLAGLSFWIFYFRWDLVKILFL